jgi:hypothetical protein
MNTRIDSSVIYQLFRSRWIFFLGTRTGQKTDDRTAWHFIVSGTFHHQNDRASLTVLLLVHDFLSFVHLIERLKATYWQRQTGLDF